MMFRSSLLLLALSSLLPSTWSQLVATPANIVCYQEVVASQGSYAQIDASLKNWSQKMYNTLNLTGPIELSVGWARVPDRTGFENNCTGPYPNIADLFVHIQTNTTAYDSISSALESFIAANRMTSQPNIVCSARSIITYLPGCGKITGGAGLNNGTNNSTSGATNSTTSAPTNATGNSNTTALPTLIPSNATGGASPSNGTDVSSSSSTASSSSSSTASSSSSSTASSSNSTTNETLPTGTGAALPSSTSISTNSTSGNSSDGSNTTTTSPVGGANTQDASATGGVTFSGAYTTTVAVGTIGAVLLGSTISVML